jgi:hypothetical protein
MSCPGVTNLIANRSRHTAGTIQAAAAIAAVAPVTTHPRRLPAQQQKQAEVEVAVCTKKHGGLQRL